ncbi:MAG: hypothetical protein P4L99_23885 [Chthoniobacter sp.]|nr:hypothetical protein [Chthoniobacter sp.]
MHEVFFKLLDQLNSSVIVLLCILLLSYYGVHIITKLWTKFSHHETKMEKVDGLSDRIIELKTKVDLIYQNTNPNRLTAAASPIAITPAGKLIAEKIGANDIFKKYLGRLSELVDEKGPKNAYDIQAVSMTVTKEKMMALLDANEINTIKAEAFAKGLLAEDIMGIFGVLLRDHILAHKGIAVAEVDTTQPSV